MTVAEPSSIIPTILQDRVPTIAVRHLALCPRMHLLALALDGDTIAIHRLSWARLATLPPPSSPSPSPITSLTWSPTGSALAVGTSSGSVRIVHVDASAASGAWKARASSSDTDDAETALGRPVTALSWVGVASADAPCLADRDVSPPRPEGLVVAGADDGSLTFFSHGLIFRAARLTVARAPVSAMHFTHGFGACFAASESADRVEVRCLSLAPLRGAMDEVLRCGAEVRALTGVVGEIAEAVGVVSKAWVGGAVGAMAKAVTEPLERLTFDFAEDTAVLPWRMLYNCFCGGGVSGALEQFFAKEIGEAGARECYRAFVAAVKEAKIALARALPLVERVVFRASEFRGLARCRRSFGKIGITVGMVEEVFGAGRDVLEALAEFAEEMEQAERQNISFLRWLTRAAVQTAGEDGAGRSADEDAEAHAEESDDLSALFFESVLVDEGGGGVGPSPDMPSALIGQIVETLVPGLQTSVEGITSAPSEVIGSALSGKCGDSESAVLSLPVVAQSRRSAMSMTSRRSMDGTSHYFYAVVLAGAEEIYVTRKDLRFSDAAFETARVRTGGPGHALCSVSFAGEGRVCFVTSTSTCSGSDKSTFSLRLARLPELSFGHGVPIAASSALDLEKGDGVAVVSDFCESGVESQCFISCEEDRSIVAALIGSKRVLLFDLKS